MTERRRSLIDRIDAYLDAAPRSAALPEEVGKFTLFRPLGPWRYYARPRRGLADSIAAADVELLRRRQRELKLPENIEWVADISASLADAAAATGLQVHRYPLMVLEPDRLAAPPLPDGISIRLVEAEDPDFARAHAVASVGFGAAGTQVGPEGALQRDATALTSPAQEQDFMRARARSGLSVTAAAFDADGPLAVGTHQPVDGVTEIVGVATLPAARRRGLGAALTAALVEDAWARAVETVFLSAGSEDVARVYAGIGFIQIGFVGAAESPPGKEDSAPDDEGVDVDARAG